MLIALPALPYIDYQVNTAGVWFASKKGRSMALAAALTAADRDPTGNSGDEYLIELAARLPMIPAWISNGMVPFVLLLAVVAGFYVFMKRKYAASNTEAVQMVFVLLLAAFLVLTVTGICLERRHETGVARAPDDLEREAPAFAHRYGGAGEIRSTKREIYRQT